MIRLTRPGLVLLCLAQLPVATLGCGTAAPKPAGDQWYLAHVRRADGAMVPFFLQLPGDCAGQTAIIANGDERIPVVCERAGRRVALDFPVYGTRISATESDTGALDGHWVRFYMPAPQSRMRFGAAPIAELDPERRFAGETGADVVASSVDVSGSWHMRFDTHGPAKGMFAQAASGVVSGTAEVPAEYGDLRFLAGTLRGTRLSLSTFDGQHAYLLEARVGPDGTLKGEFLCCDEVRDTFVAERSDDFQVVDPLQQVRVVSDHRRLDLAELSDAKYTGKAVIIEIFGTWCPNCNDLAPLLGELYEAYHDEGLEVLGLAYELSEDAAYTQARLAAYRQKHRLMWDVVIAQSPPEELFGDGPARLSPIEGVPVTIFLNRDRTVRAIYTGFSGPATGAAHEAARARFRTLSRAILDSR